MTREQDHPSHSSDRRDRIVARHDRSAERHDRPAERHDRQAERHDWNGSHLEALLQEPEAHIPDYGFTDRVMASLPPPRRAPRPCWRWVILTVSGVLGAAVGLAVLLGLDGGAQHQPLRRLLGDGDGRAVDLLWQALSWSPAMLPMSLPVIPLLLAALLLGVSLAYARAHA